MKFAKYKILQNQHKAFAIIRGGVAAQVITTTRIRANTVMTIMMNMRLRVPGLQEVAKVLARARGTRKRDIINLKVEMRAKLPSKAIDLKRDIIKTTRKKITISKTHDSPKEILHRVNSRGFATRTRMLVLVLVLALALAAKSSRAMSWPSDKKKWKLRSLSNWRRSHPTDSRALKTFSTENK